MAQLSNHFYCNTSMSQDEPHPTEWNQSKGEDSNPYETYSKQPAGAAQKGNDERKLWKIASIVFLVIMTVTSLFIAVISLAKVLKVEAEVQAQHGSIQKGYKELEDGWVGLFNGYQYKLTNTPQNYTDSRKECQAMGAALAVYGVQEIENRKILQRAMSIDQRFWIGLNDREVEGKWRWEDGEVATDETALWMANEPNNHHDQDCGNLMTSGSLLSSDAPCSTSIRALCEKAFQN